MFAAVTPDAIAELDPAFVRAFRAGTLTEAQAQTFAEQDPLVIKFQMLELAGLVAAKKSPHAPPGSQAPFEKSEPKNKRRKKRGARKGHEGHARPKPERIDKQVEHQLPHCPDCGGKLQRTNRTRIVEDSPADLKAEVTEHTIGQLMQMLMLATVVEGRLLGTNPYGQPGVEAYKSNMMRILKATPNLPKGEVRDQTKGH